MENDIISSMLAAFGVFFIFLGLIVIVIEIAEWKLFKKAGKKGWEALIPFYSTWILIEITGLNWWYFLISISGTILSVLNINSPGMTIISNLASIFVNFLIFYNLAKKARKNEKLYGILSIFFSGILIMILGFSKNVTIDNNIVVSPNGPIGEGKTDATNSTTNNVNTVNNTTTNNTIVCPNCGKDLKENTNFCTNCGQNLQEK